MPQTRRNPPERSSYRFFYWLLGGIAVAGIVALVVAVVRAKSTSAATEPVDMGNLSAQQLYQQAKPETIGPDNAPARLVIFSDYMCPFCGQWAAQVQPRLVDDYVKQGKLQIVFYDFPLGGAHRFSFLASRAARCAGDQGKFWPYHDVLFGKQSEWAASSSAPVGALEQYAADLGLNTSTFNSCLESDAHADVVTANRLLGEQLGVNATPTVIVDQKRMSNPLDYGVLQQLIGQATGTPTT